MGSVRQKRKKENGYGEYFSQDPPPQRQTAYVDRNCLTHEQYLDLLATPKGLPWTGEQNLEADITKKRKKSKRGETAINRKEAGDFADDFVDDMWDLMTPDISNRLIDFLVNEYGMSVEEAVDFIDCKSAVGKQNICKASSGPAHKWPKLFSNVFSKRIEDYINGILLSAKTPREKMFAKKTLEFFSKWSGEKIKSNHPKTNAQGALVLAADRLAFWIDDLLRDIDKPVKRRPGVMEPDIKEEKEEEIESAEEESPKEYAVKKEEDLKKEASKDTEGVEEKEPEKEEPDKQQEKGEEELPAEDLYKSSDEKLEKQETGEEHEEPEAEEKLEEPEDEKKLEEAEEKPQESNEKEEEKEPETEEQKEPEITEQETETAEEKEREIAEEIEPETAEEEKDTERALEEKEEVEAQKEEEGEEKPTKETTEEKLEEVEEEQKSPKEEEITSEKEEDKAPEEEIPEEENVLQEGQDAKEEEVLEEKESLKEEKVSKEEEIPEKESIEEPIPEEKQKSFKEASIQEEEVVKESEVKPYGHIFDLIKNDIANIPKDKITDRHKFVKDAVDKRFQKMMAGKELPEGLTPEDIDDATSRVAHWVDSILGATEIPKKEVSSKGGAFQIKPKTGSTFAIQKLSSSTVAKATAQVRGLTKPTRKIPDSVSPMNLKSAQEWVDWASSVANVADDWGKWLDSKLTDAEKHIKNKKKGTEHSNWKQWRDKVQNEALRWRAEKNKIRDEGKLWDSKILESEIRSTDL